MTETRPAQIVITRRDNNIWRVLLMNESGTLSADDLGKDAALALIEGHLESLELIRDIRKRLGIL